MMSIERTQPALPISTVNAFQELNGKSKSENLSVQATADNKDSGTQVKLSPMAQKIKADSSQDINFERIAEIRSAMEAGELTFDADKIAHALVDDIFNLT